MFKLIYSRTGAFCQTTTNVFGVQIEANDNVCGSQIVVYMDADRVDFDCKKLSKLCPNLKIDVLWGSVLRATYRNGERTVLRSITDIFVNVTDEDIASSLFRDSATAEMI